MSRYIDAEAFLEKAYKRRPSFAPDDFMDGYNDIIRQIKDEPTADVEEVRHGKWEVRHRHEHYPSGKPYEENVCPFCKRADHNGDGLYCGYCGAKMDGGKE